MEVIFCKIELGSRPNVASSISAKFGLALTKSTEFAVEIKEKDGTIIYSKRPMLFIKLHYSKSRQYSRTAIEALLDSDLDSDFDLQCPSCPCTCKSTL